MINILSLYSLYKNLTKNNINFRLNIYNIIKVWGSKKQES